MTRKLSSERSRGFPVQSRRGVALILVLGLVTMLSLLVMGFMAAVRLEHSTARNYNNLIKTRNLTEGALADALTRVALATPPLSTTKTWVSAPGVVYQIGNDGVWVPHRLFSIKSGSPSSVPDVDWHLQRMNLNDGAWITGQNSAYGSSTNSYPTNFPAFTNVNFPAKWPGAAATNWSIWAGWENIDTNGWLSGVQIAPASTNISPSSVATDYLASTVNAGCQQGAALFLGQDFTVTQPISVTRLGAYDHNLDGIQGPVFCSLYNVTAGTRIANVTINTSVSPWDSSGRFRMASITPVALTNGVVYAVGCGGYAGSDWFGNSFFGPCPGPSLTAGTASYIAQGTDWNIASADPATLAGRANSSWRRTAFNLTYERAGPIVTNYLSAIYQTNALAGRFTYWMDDETCKVNLNTAMYRDPGAANSSTLTDIDMRGLEPPLGSGTNSVATIATLDEFHAAAVAQPFNTPEEARLGFNPAMDYGSFQRNKFYTTVNAKEPNTDAFGQERVNVNGIGSATSGSAYDQFTSDLWTTMLYSNALQGADNRNTFQKKYGDFGIRQMLANMISYRQSFATAPPMSTLGAAATGQAGIPDYYAGLKKGPMLESIIVQVATNKQIVGVDPDLTTNVDVRLYIHPKLVNGYETDSVADYTVDADFDWTVDYVDTNGTAQTMPMTGKSWSMSSLPVVPANSFYLARTADTAVGNIFTNVPGATNATLNVPNITNITVNLKRVRLLRSPAADTDIMDWMAVTDFTNAFPNGMRFNAVAGDGFGDIVETNMFPDAFTNNLATGFKPVTLGKQDPRVRTFPGWIKNTSHFAGVGSSSNEISGSVTNEVWYNTPGPNFETNWWVYPVTNSAMAAMINPIGDDVISTNYSSRLAPSLWGLIADSRTAAGTNAAYSSHRYLGAVIKEAAYTSVGELADVHTGYPWRTIRFRSVVPETTTDPNQYHVADPQLAAPYIGVGDPNTGLEEVEKYAIADWVMIDMFQVGNLGVTDVVEGRLNINQRFDVAGSDDLLNPSRTLNPRVAPLKALLANITPDLYSTNSVITSGTLGTNFTTYLFSSSSNSVWMDGTAPWNSSGRWWGNRFDVLSPITVTHIGIVDPKWGDDPNVHMGGIGHYWFGPGFNKSWFTSDYWSNGFARVCDSSGNEVVPRELFKLKVNAFIDPTSNFWMRAVAPVQLNPGTYYLQVRNQYGINRVPTAPGAVAGIVNVVSSMYVSPSGQANATEPEPSGVLTTYSQSPLTIATLIYSNNTAGVIDVTTQGATSYGVDLLAHNISRRSLQSQSPYAANPLFATPGEVCEVTGMGFSSTSNTVASVPNKFERQRIIRRISNLITTRSHAFSYYGMGELVKDRDNDGIFDWTYYTPMVYVPTNSDVDIPNTIATYGNFKIWTNGVISDGDGDLQNDTDEVLGRARYHAIIERYEDGGATKVRSLYNRYYKDVLE